MADTALTLDRTGPGAFRPRRLLVAIALLALAAMPGQLGSLTRALMTDAFVQVSVFVAATLLIFYGAERLFRFDIGDALSRSKGWQVPLSALLGATPGCGGAVMVVAAHASGNVGFGAVVATLTATMGDAAFLLIATRPDAAAVVLPLGFAVGVLSGWITDAIEGRRSAAPAPRGAACQVAPLIGKVRAKDLLYLALAAPGLSGGAAQLGQVEIDSLLGLPVEVLGVAGIALGLWIWARSPLMAMTNTQDNPVTRMAEETAFISVWVVGAYLLYDYATAFAGLDLRSWFQAVGPLLPLIGAAVGLVPGCGPQVLVTTLYVNGLVPFSAQIANAISNDGDALFPAIALDPRTAVRATIYSTMPALALGYGFHILAPGVLN